MDSLCRTPMAFFFAKFSYLHTSSPALFPSRVSRTHALPSAASHNGNNSLTLKCLDTIHFTWICMSLLFFWLVIYSHSPSKFVCASAGRVLTAIRGDGSRPTTNGPNHNKKARALPYCWCWQNAIAFVPKPIFARRFYCVRFTMPNYTYIYVSTEHRCVDTVKSDCQRRHRLRSLTIGRLLHPCTPFNCQLESDCFCLGFIHTRHWVSFRVYVICIHGRTNVKCIVR